MSHQISFKEKQLSFARVRDAYAEKETIVQKYFQLAGCPYWNFQVFIRAIKTESKLEIWVTEKGKNFFILLTAYEFSASSGMAGPKKKEGDLQIPEGIYFIKHFNPESKFHLSLGINYPNESDRFFAGTEHPGGDIYIHGDSISTGCIPINDDKIKELYVICVEARQQGQMEIPVHIFPAKRNRWSWEKITVRVDGETETRWNNLAPIFEDFENTRALRPIQIKQGFYYFPTEENDAAEQKESVDE